MFHGRPGKPCKNGLTGKNVNEQPNLAHVRETGRTSAKHSHLAKNTVFRPKRASGIPVQKQCTPTVQLEGQGSQGGLNPLGIVGGRGLPPGMGGGLRDHVGVSPEAPRKYVPYPCLSQTVPRCLIVGFVIGAATKFCSQQP